MIEPQYQILYLLVFLIGMIVGMWLGYVVGKKDMELSLNKAGYEIDWKNHK